MSAQLDWQTKAKAFKDGLTAKFPKEYILPSPIPSEPLSIILDKVLTSEEKDITSLDATTLAAAIAEKKYTSVQVIKAFAHASVVVHQKTNALVDFFLDEAVERAQWLDDELERTGKTVGPLHGVPVSVKDHMGVKGHELTGGYLSWVNTPPATDAVLVSIFRQAGAVFWVKTTNPQALMALETNSFLGPTMNPFNAKVVSGGSSGGEGALVGGYGSPLGAGTDIGGSIRGPASFNGLFGFKPTAPRSTVLGGKGTQAGQISIPLAIGPLAHSAQDLELFVTTALAGKPWRLDPAVVAMPWRPEEVTFSGKGGKLRVGVLWDDGVVKPLPPLRRALELTVKKLKEAGVEVVDYKAYEQKKGWFITSALYFTDGGVASLAEITKSGEPVLPLTKYIHEMNTKNRSAHELWDLINQRDAFRAAYDAHFASYDVDVIISPASPGPAGAVGTTKYWSYTSIFNLVDYPAGVFPTGITVDPKVDGKEKREYWGAEDEQVWTAYDAKLQAGVPVGLQVVGPRWEDEKVMEALKIVSGIVRS
ncbi:hypothetical protein IAT38_008173 [Cryptococcus sp. DSM 104549]